MQKFLAGGKSRMLYFEQKISCFRQKTQLVYLPSLFRKLIGVTALQQEQQQTKLLSSDKSKKKKEKTKNSKKKRLKRNCEILPPQLRHCNESSLFEIEHFSGAACILA